MTQAIHHNEPSFACYRRGYLRATRIANQRWYLNKLTASCYHVEELDRDELLAELAADAWSGARVDTTQSAG